jgi:hypothetical protein
LATALDPDPRILYAEFDKLLRDGAAETPLESVVAGSPRWAGWMAGNDDYAQQRAVLDDLKLADLGVAG